MTKNTAEARSDGFPAPATGEPAWRPPKLVKGWGYRVTYSETGEPHKTYVFNGFEIEPVEHGRWAARMWERVDCISLGSNHPSINTAIGACRAVAEALRKARRYG